MTTDERAIRDLLATWNRATLAGDTATVLTLMTEDVLFFGPGRPPIRGREEFAALAGAGLPFNMDIDSNIGEVVVAGDMASVWTHLAVTVTPGAGATPIRRSGYTLTVFRRMPDGRWLLSRDANMMTVEAAGSVSLLAWSLRAGLHPGVPDRKTTVRDPWMQTDPGQRRG